MAQVYPTPNQGAPALTASGIPAMGAAGNTAQNCIPGTLCMETLLPLANGSELQVAQHPTGIFVDDFACIGVPGCTSGTLDTTNKWNSPTTSGGTSTAATNAVGATVLGSGTTASGWSQLTSQPAFQPQNPGYLFVQTQVKLEAQVSSLFKINAFRAFGLVNVPTTPTTTIPLLNAATFVIDTAGKLRAQTWGNGGGTGTLNKDVDLSVFSSLCACIPMTLVADGTSHRYVTIFRGDNILWKIDDRFVAQVTTGADGPDVNSVNVGAVTVAGGTPPATSATIEFDQVTVGALAPNQNRICDSFFGWRCAIVGPTGALLPAIPQTPIQGNAAGTTGAVVGTLAAAAAKFTYICGFNVQAIGGTAAVGPITIAGLVTASQVYQASSSAAGGTIASASFTPCIPSSAVNTAITVTTTADGTASAVDVNSWGYQQ